MSVVVLMVSSASFLTYPTTKSNQSKSLSFAKSGSTYGGSELISHKFGGGRSAEKPSVWILLMKCGVHLSENIGDLHHLPGFVTICHLYFPFVCFYVCCAFVSIPHHPSRD